ncbi:uncharacterized protein LOC129747949 [Uranotaenia lowii]|uniref:uncharacterized protein LOC129747949 n=1 Tax=Uranotaenia lowii TaxID=190385 RepID=UPI002478DB35|nr:uncharacterized protein LOC129747949 [Uranotaenia lowii]
MSGIKKSANKKAVYRAAFRKNLDYAMAGIPEIEPSVSSSLYLKKRRLMSVADDSPEATSFARTQPVIVSSEETDESDTDQTSVNLSNEPVEEEPGAPIAVEDCDCKKKVDDLMQKLHEKDAEMKSLRQANMNLQRALVSKLIANPDEPFKDHCGIIGVERIKRFNEEAGDSDYLFVKFLMNALWPEGFRGRSISGRPSNNPSGLKKSTDRDQSVQHTQTTRLEEDKIRFIKDRLRERREFFRDDAAATLEALDKCNRFIRTVMYNSLRKKS